MIRPEAVSDVQALAQQAANRLLASLDSGIDWPALDQLVDLAISEAPAQHAIGRRALFGDVIEAINDTHDAALRPIYRCLFAHVIERVRALPAAADLDRALRRRGFRDAASLIAYADQVCHARVFDSNQAAGVRKILLLSRVTIGSDIAANAPALTHLRRVFPDAELILFGDPALAALFAALPGARVRAASFPRDSNLTDQLRSFVALDQAVQAELQGLTPAEYLFVGMDSRLDQLMLLPLTDRPERYFGWQNVLPRFQLESGPPPIARQAADWLQRTFPAAPAELLPALYLDPADRAAAAALYAECGLTRPVIALNFGVGGNDRKRIGETFEVELVAGLAAAGAQALISVGPDFIDRAAALRRRLEARGLTVTARSLTSDRPSPDGGSPPIAGCAPNAVFVQATLGQTAALLERAHAYAGYDSMAQHMAAAVGRDVFVAFAGYTLPHFPDRWTPVGRGRVALLRAGAGPFSEAAQAELAARLLGLLEAGSL